MSKLAAIGRLLRIDQKALRRESRYKPLISYKGNADGGHLVARNGDTIGWIERNAAGSYGGIAFPAKTSFTARKNIKGLPTFINTAGHDKKALNKVMSQVRKVYKKDRGVESAYAGTKKEKLPMQNGRPARRQARLPFTAKPATKSKSRPIRVRITRKPSRQRKLL